jgi:Protein of unknown function (DUF2911)
MLVSSLIARASGAPLALAPIPASPAASLSQQIGLTIVSLDYTRPAVRGRSLGETLAPAGRLWAPDASAVPKISFNREVVFLGQPVPAGRYNLLMVPAAAADGWTVILNRDAYMPGPNRYRYDLDVVRARAQVLAAPHRERLTFSFSELSDDHAVLELAWDDLCVQMPIEVHTTQQIETAIASLDDAWRWYADAARYMLNVRQDYDAGLRYIDQSLRLEVNAENVRLKTALQAALESPARGSHLKRTRLARALASRRRAAPSGRGLTRLSLSGVDSESRIFQGHAGSAPTQVATTDEPMPVERPARTAGATRSPPPNEIGPVIKKGRLELEACYQRALRQDPSLTRARVNVSISIGVSGTVRRVVLDPPSASAPLAACITSAISRWAFPPAPVEYGTEFPVVLRGAN